MSHSYKWGLKIWSINKQYVDEAWKLYDDGLYHYIELFSVPGSFDASIQFWKQLPIPFVIHAPHYSVGLNFAKSEQEDQNKKLALESFQFADALNASHVIFHPGVEGRLEETIRQMKRVHDSRMLIENKPYYGFDDYTTKANRLLCMGSISGDVKRIMSETGVGLCLDIPHAFCTANTLGKDIYDYLEEFLVFNPIMLHLSDGDSKGTYDEHLNIGKGTYDFKKIFQIIGLDRTISIETKKLSNTSLESFKVDITELNRVAYGE
jgi:deoxyribonuclease-4